MLLRKKLETLMRKLSDDDFDAVWKHTYGTYPIGDRALLVKDYVAEQYDDELEDAIQYVNNFLAAMPRPKTKAKSRALAAR
jgi:hypothetical protein